MSVNKCSATVKQGSPGRNAEQNLYQGGRKVLPGAMPMKDNGTFYYLQTPKVKPLPFPGLPCFRGIQHEQGQAACLGEGQ